MCEARYLGWRVHERAAGWCRRPHLKLRLETFDKDSWHSRSLNVCWVKWAESRSRSNIDGPCGSQLYPFNSRLAQLWPSFGPAVAHFHFHVAHSHTAAPPPPPPFIRSPSFIFLQLFFLSPLLYISFLRRRFPSFPPPSPTSPPLSVRPQWPKGY